jgi:multidrug efflux system membrane fusion protein
VTAPISGLGLRQADVGNNVTTSDTNGLVIITQLQPITAIFSIPEDNIPKVLQQLQSGASCRPRPGTASRRRNWPTACC